MTTADDPGGVVVGVPVRNEVRRLPRLLAALAAQEGAPAFTLCLFFDSCDDGSVELVDALAPQMPYPIRVACSETFAPPNAGRARRRAMALALATAPDGVLLTTDADSEPAADWLAANLAAAACADVIAGCIARGGGREDDAPDRVERYYHRLHLLRRSLDPVSWEDAATHHWTSGASLAMRAATYRALGGFPDVASGEDALLGDAATRAGFRVRRDARVVVRTSARRRGRAEGGYATALAALDGERTPPAVTHPQDEDWRFRRQAEARRLHGSGDYRPLAQRLALPIAEVAQVAGECRNGEAFAARIVGVPPGGARMVGLGHAEALLSLLEQAALEGAA